MCYDALGREDCGVSPSQRLLATLAACNIIQEFAILSDTRSAATTRALSKCTLPRVTPRAEWPSRPAIVNSEKPRSPATLAKVLTENMWRHVIKLRLRADLVENPNHPDEMPAAPIGREDILRTFSTCRVDAGDRGLPENPDLPAALGVGKADTILLWTQWPAKLIAPMLARFIAGDRAFAS